jgi:hypothetical protein
MTYEYPETYPQEADVEAVIAEFGGDARAALRAVLHDLAVLAADYESCVSKGFVRGRLAVQKFNTNAGATGGSSAVNATVGTSR